MPESVIVDDGGSTRIKWNLPGGLGDMRNLQNGDPQIVTSPFSRVVVRSIDDRANDHLEFDINFADTVEVSSGFGQKVLLRRTGNNQSELTITLTGPPVAPPIIVPKTLNGKRRYIVENAGTIEVVRVDGAVRYTASNDRVFSIVMLLA